MSGPDELLPAAVPPDFYDESYFREWCAGYAEWVASDGAEIAGLYPGSLARAGLVPGETLVDFVTGRGELLVSAVRAGARRAVGVDYSADAVRLARHTLEVNGVEDRAEVVLADSRRIPVADGFADLVTMLDVVEHLPPEELAATLSEAHRIVRPGGRIFVHTFPTKTVYDVTYRWQRRLRPSRLRTWPRDPRNDFERRLHVNEQTKQSLRRSLQAAGFVQVSVETGGWVHDEMVPDPGARRTYHLLARFAPTRSLGAADLWGSASRASGAGTPVGRPVA